MSSPESFRRKEPDMSDLKKWKASTEGWPVNGITPDSAGLDNDDKVIFDGDAGKVYKNDKDSPWGTITAATDDKVEGAVDGTKWSFEITCPDGNLHGILSATPVTHLSFGARHHGHGSHEDHPHSD